MRNLRLFFLVFSLNILTLTACQKSDLLGSNGSSLFDEIGGEAGLGGSCGIMTAPECEMLAIVNEYRASQGRTQLKALDKCTVFSRDHARDMVDRNFFSHDSPTETFSARVARYGIGYPAGENIAKGSDDVETIFNMWKNSPGHNANMLNSSYRSLGVGYYQGHWVQCFSGE